MPHFAKIIDGRVNDVARIESSCMTDSDGRESERLGIEFLTQLTGHAHWVLTSYTGEIRGRYAGQGFVWDEVKNAFYPAQPFPSWTLNETTWDWEPPIALPENPEAGVNWLWDEAQRQWEKVVEQ